MERHPPLRVIRGASATGWWEFVRWRPDDRLAPLVTGITGYQERSQAKVERHYGATSTIQVIVSFGDELEIDMAGRTDQRFESFVAGFHPGPAATRYRGGQLGIQIDLTPFGVFRLLGVPGSAVASQIIDLGDLAPALGGDDARDRLASCTDWAARLALVDDALTSMAADGPRPDPMVAWLWHQLQTTGGRARIADLVAETGRSHRYVADRFRQQIGLTPKAASRVLRYERAADMLSSDGLPPAEVAARCGYADQSHLNREVARLAGTTPTAFGPAGDDPSLSDAETVNFVQDGPI